MRLRFLATAVLFPSLFLTGGCSDPPATNVLLISFDTTRADRLSPWGGLDGATPTLAGLAERGVLFERAWSHVASTLPAHSSLMTGKLPPRHGVRCNGLFRLPAQETTLAEVLAADGYSTGAVLGALPLDRRFGLDQGFESWDDRFGTSTGTGADTDRAPGDVFLDPAGTRRAGQPGNWIGHPYTRFERTAADVTRAALRWLAGRPSRWFLFVHYFDPHWPYVASGDARSAMVTGAAGEAAYLEEIRRADAELGRLLDAVAARSDETLVVFTADHGESLGEHGEDWHNRFVYNSTQHVPLVFSLPGRVEEGKRVRTDVGHVDVLPTVLDLLGISPPVRGDGRSLSPVLHGDEELPAQPVYMETLVGALERGDGTEVRALVRDRLKIIETRTAAGGAPKYELYDLAWDPGEVRNLLVAGPVPGAVAASGLAAASEERRLEVARDLAGDLLEMAAALDKGAPKPQVVVLDADSQAGLKALGYLGD